MLERSKETDRGMRLDLFLSSKTTYSRSQLQKMIAGGEVLVDGMVVKKNYLLKGNELISWQEVIEAPPGPEEMDLDIIYQDKLLALINKPAGLVVHPGHGVSKGTLVSGLLALGWPLSDLGGEERPGIVHRLDKDTSGLLIIAKDNKTHGYLKEEFLKKRVKRIYWALVEGRPKWQEKTIEGFLERNPRNPTTFRLGNKGRYSRTDFRLLSDYGDYSLIECQLDTGRTHQIRVHLKSLNLPLVGDRIYGSRTSRARGEHQLLHSKKLEFRHPEGENMSFEAPLPLEFTRFLEWLEARLP